MNGWSPEILHLAEAAVSEARVVQVGGNHYRGDDVVSVNIAFDMATFDSLPPFIRHLLNYSTDKFAAADLVLEACRQAMPPAKLCEVVEGKVPMSPRAPDPATWLILPHAAAEAMRRAA